ncbi:globin-like protein [Aaosphaeria arxii CBS 175.79]|uniref:nitric oxide dioxygenase n=1 Tax=Aaosphaeria arxii CBS 175.79 TaxID=1450172 RepID=A0A6A5Y7Z2_9PLEO|nr:globin-like protein [Aaosphaeria arxii CBS 175.79]KAF2020674.1 globin-like protein [Aaosphaeria arxii CBS 175.79]
MAPALKPEQVAIIKATVPVLAAHGLAITTKFYHDMIEANPELKNIFNNTHQSTGHQPAALAGALYAYAANIDALGNLSAAVELICHKHTSLFIRAPHYAIVGKHLLETMKVVLGDACTDEILDAWGAAYWQLADIMINKEAAMYEETKQWDDWKEFTIAKKEKESEQITSFYLEPVDKALKLPIFKPGQYISVNIFVDELGVWQARQYSLSDAPGKSYLRISVKKEAGVEIGEPKSMTHEGYLSNLLHQTKNEGDIVKVSHPWGDFFLDEDKIAKDAPVVLIAAGVGLTCLNSIFTHLAAQKTSRPIVWIHGARDSNHRAFKAHTDSLAANNENVQTVYFSSKPQAEDVQGRDYDIEGRIELAKVGSDKLFTGDNKAEYYTCGPKDFMLSMEEQLKSLGVPSERIHMELFGTGGVPRV